MLTPYTTLYNLEVRKIVDWWPDGWPLVPEVLAQDEGTTSFSPKATR